MASEELTYTVDLKDRFSRPMKDMRRQTERTDKKMSRLRSKASGLGKTIGALGAGAAIAGLGKHVVDTIHKFERLRRETQQLTGQVNADLSQTTTRVQAVAQTFDKDYMEVLNAANSASKNFDITMGQALEKIEKGFMAGADASGEFLKQIKEYGPQFRDAEASANELFATIARSSREGAFSDKMVDAVKEFGVRVREQTKPAREALVSAFGEDFTNELFGNLNSGAITTVDALKKVTGKLKNTDTTAKETQRVIADLFGGPGEDLGMELLKSMSDMNGELDSMIEKNSELTKAQQRRLSLNKELAKEQETLAKNTQQFGNAWEETWKQIQTGFFSFLNEANKKLLQIKADSRFQEAKIGAGAERKKAGFETAQEELNKRLKGKGPDEKREVLDRMVENVQERIESNRQSAKSLLERAKKFESRDAFPEEGDIDEKKREFRKRARKLGRKNVQFKGALTAIKSRLKGLENTEDPDGEDEPEDSGGGDESEDTGVTKITSAPPKTINITIGNMVENFSVEPQTLDEAAPEVREKIEEVFLQALNNAQTTENG